MYLWMTVYNGGGRDFMNHNHRRRGSRRTEEAGMVRDPHSIPIVRGGGVGRRCGEGFGTGWKDVMGSVTPHSHNVSIHDTMSGNFGFALFFSCSAAVCDCTT